MSSSERLLLKATAGDTAFDYIPAFAQIRRLPTDDPLAYSAVREVVVGWSQADACWHLGLLLVAAAAQARGGRWCELARWYDDTGETWMAGAREAGQALAQIIDRPFRFVPAVVSQGARSQVPATESALAASPQPTYAAMEDDSAAEAPAVYRVARQPAKPIDLPLEVGRWTLQRIAPGLQWSHTRAWHTGLLGQVIFRLVVGIFFVGVSILTLQSSYAPVQPFGLPILGIAIGLVLIYAAFRKVLLRLRAEVVVVDRSMREIRRHSLLTSDVIATYPFDDIRAVVATQIAHQKTTDTDTGVVMVEHEAWLHLLLNEAANGGTRRRKPEADYITIGRISVTEGEAVDRHFDGRARQRAVQPFYPDEATTPVLQAAVVLARAIGVDAYLDQR